LRRQLEQGQQVLAISKGLSKPLVQQHEPHTPPVEDLTREEPEEEKQAEPQRADEGGKKRKGPKYSPEEWAAWEEEQKKAKQAKTQHEEDDGEKKGNWIKDHLGKGSAGDEDSLCFACKNHTWDGSRCTDPKCKKYNLGRWSTMEAKDEAT